MNMPLKALFTRPGVGRAVLVSGLALGVLVGCGGTTNGNAPTITSFTPTSGVYTSAGTNVTVNGSGFTTNVTSIYVTVGGVKTDAGTLNSDAQLIFPVPAGAVTGPIRVVTNGGTGTSAANFTVTPTLNTTTPISPTSGSAGSTQVTINGWGLEGVTEVQFGSSDTVGASEFTSATANAIVFTVPQGIAKGTYTLTLISSWISSPQTVNFVVD